MTLVFHGSMSKVFQDDQHAEKYTNKICHRKYVLHVCSQGTVLWSLHFRQLSPRPRGSSP